MGKFFKGRVRSIWFALEGCVVVLKNEKNTWVHAFLTICAGLLGFWLELTKEQWILLILTITIVWAAEFFNSAIEMMIDLFSPDIHPMAKKGKDIGAAAVLISAFGSVLVGFLLFWDPLIVKLTSMGK